MMDYLHLGILAIVQGLTEFLPVSSSGHLALAKEMLGFDSVTGLGVELLLHGGTVVAVLLYYRRLIGEIFCNLVKGERAAWRFAIAVMISMVPAVLLGLTCEEALESFTGNPAFVCCMLMITGAVLILTRCVKGRFEKDVSPLRGLAMGIAQAFAMLPGISRSGSTIAMSRFLGVATEKAAAFSFLMVVPVIIGGNLYHLTKAMSDESGGIFEGLDWGSGILGFVLSAVVGYLSVAWMVKLLGKRTFWKFGIYCLAIGLIGLTYCLLK